MESQYHPFRTLSAIRQAVKAHLSLYELYYQESGHKPPAEAMDPGASLGHRLLAMHYQEGERIGATYENYAAACGRPLNADAKTATIASIHLHGMLEACLSIHARDGSITYDLSAIAEMLEHTDTDQTFSDLCKYAPYTNFYLYFGPRPTLALPSGDFVEGAYVLRLGDTNNILAVTTAPSNGESRLLQLRYLGERIGHPIEVDYNTMLLTDDQQTQLVHLIKSALLYLNSEDPEITEDWPAATPADLIRRAQSPNPGEANKWRSKLDAQGFHKVMMVGRTLGARLASIREDAARRQVSTHWRKGHWRRVVIGVGRTGRRWHWFQPQLVMPDAGAAPTGTVYVAPHSVEQIPDRPT